MSPIKITPVTGLELYVKLSGQNGPQACYVELDARNGGSLSASANPGIGNAVPMSVHAAHVMRFSIPALKPDAANALLLDLEPTARIVVAGYEPASDDHGNLVGGYDSRAMDALERIRERCDRFDDGIEETAIQVWEAVDWFAGSGIALARGLGITATTTDAELEAIEKTEMDGARGEGIDILVGLHAYLKKLRHLVIADGE